MSWNESRIERREGQALRRNVSLWLRESPNSLWYDTERPLNVELVRLAPGASSWPHQFNPARWGVYSIEKGLGRVSSPMGWIEVHPGDWILQPPGRPHQLINTGESELWMLVIFCRTHRRRAPAQG